MKIMITMIIKIIIKTMKIITNIKIIYNYLKKRVSLVIRSYFKNIIKDFFIFIIILLIKELCIPFAIPSCNFLIICVFFF